MNGTTLNFLLLGFLLVLQPTPASEAEKKTVALPGTLPRTVEVARDGSGRLVRRSELSAGEVVTRDASGRLLARSDTRGDRTTHRDASGRLLGTTTSSSPGREVTCDAGGRLQTTATTNAGGDVMTFRDASGRILGTKTTSGSGAVMYRDTSGRLTGPDFK